MPKVLPSTPAPAGRLGRGRRVSSTLAEINIIPLVDVMLVLLIIFMVAAPMMQKGVEVNLPVASRSQEMGEQIFVSVPLSYKEDSRVFIGDEPVRIDVLSERVRQLLVNKGEKQVFLRLDGKLEIQDQMDIFDRLKAGGIEKVGIVSKLPGER